MKHLATLILSAAFSPLLNAQQPTWSWAEADGAVAGYENVSEITADVNGRSYIAGVFNGGITVFGNDTLQNSGNAGTMDAYITCYDINGNVVWVQGIHGNGDAQVTAMITDNAGNLIVAGRLSAGLIQIGNDIISGYQYNIFFAKFDANGNALWSAGCGSSLSSAAGGIAVSSLNEIYFVGHYSGSGLLLDSDTLPATTGGSDIFILKYDAAGTLLQAYSLPNTGTEEVGAAAFAPNGNLMIGGQFRGTAFVIANDTLSSSGSYADFFIACLSPALVPQWGTSVSGNYQEEITALATDANSAICIAGLMKSAQLVIGADTLNNAPNTENILVAKYDANGAPLWGRTYGTISSYDIGRGIIVDIAGNPTFMASASAGTIVGNDTLATALAIVTKLDPAGNVIWTTGVAAAGYVCTSDPLDNFYMAGTIGDTTAFGPLSVIPPGQNDVFNSQMSMHTDIPGYEPVSPSLHIYPNPSQGATQLSGLNLLSENIVTVYSLTGAVVRSITLQPGENLMDLSGLSRGVYVVRINDNGNSCKVILE
jgi:hypothetical protein